MGSFTVWIPLHDCPVEAGALTDSGNFSSFWSSNHRSDYGDHRKRNSTGRRLGGGQINSGDVLIFHDLTVHSATPNTSNQLRISMDCRFQDYARAINPANLVFPGSNGRSWEATYANWLSDNLKYYWKTLPLAMKPSLAELAELSEGAEITEMRPRYARILSQLKSQMPVPANVR